MVVIEVQSSKEFYSRLLDNKTYRSTIVDFYAQWCGPCKIIKPYFEELSYAYPHVQFLKVDVDKFPEISSWANVRGLPTFMGFKDGKKLSEIVGIDKKQILDSIKKLAS